MAVDTKPNFSSKKFEQCATDIMNLSGCTQIYGMFDIETGATLTICENAGVGKILTSDGTGIATWQDAAAEGVTSLSGGSGMNFSPITSTGEIVLGTPSAILNTSTDISSGNTHHHVFSASTFVSGTEGILVDGSNRFYLDNTYIAEVGLPDLTTVNNVTSNQSLGSLPSGQTLGMVYITNTGSTQAVVNLGTTSTGNDITSFQAITIDPDEDVSVTVNMRLSITETKTIYINSDDWTDVGLNVQWAHISYDNVPLPTGGTSYSFIGSGSTQVLEEGNQITIYSPTGGTGGGLSTASNGLTDDGTTVKLGGVLSENTCIGGAGNYGVSMTGLTYFCVAAPFASSAPIDLLTDGSVNLKGCNVCASLGGASFNIYDYLGNGSIELGTGNNVRFCCLAAKSIETDVLYINSSTGQIATGATSGGASPGGSDGQMQYNNGDSFGGTNLCFDDSLNHIGWNKSATSDAMFVIKKDVDYFTSRTIMEFFSCDTSESSDLSQFKICVGKSNFSDCGSAVYVREICGYDNDSISCLDIHANDYVGINNILKLTPTSEPSSPLEGMVYYDSTANKLKVYTGISWETISSS